MGASTFAFSSLRRAVIGEGITEVILIPTLLREATGLPVIDFQVAPGIASVRPEAVESLDASAARIAYLVDGDEGGLAHRQKLLDAGIDEGRIVILGGGAEPLAVEDLIERDSYLCREPRARAARASAGAERTWFPMLGASGRSRTGAATTTSKSQASGPSLITFLMSSGAGSARVCLPSYSTKSAPVQRPSYTTASSHFLINRRTLRLRRAVGKVRPTERTTRFGSLLFRI